MSVWFENNKIDNGNIKKLKMYVVFNDDFIKSDISDSMFKAKP